jgi:hypothetical protein
MMAFARICCIVLEIHEKYMAGLQQHLVFMYVDFVSADCYV